MADAPVATKTPIQWAALVATAALLWGVVWAVGSQFRDYLRVDTRQFVSELIAEHAKDANANRAQFFRDVESRADNAVSRVVQLERSCDVVQSRFKATDEQLAELNKWRTQCGERMARVTHYIEGDDEDIRELRQTVNELQRNLEAINRDGTRKNR